MRRLAVFWGCAGLWLTGCANHQDALSKTAKRWTQAEAPLSSRAPVQIVIYDQNERVRSVSGLAIASEPTSSGTFSYVLTHADALDSRGLIQPRMSVSVDQPDGAAYEFSAAPVAVGRIPDVNLALIKVQGVAITERRGVAFTGAPSSTGQPLGVSRAKIRQFLTLSGFGRFVLGPVSGPG